MPDDSIPNPTPTRLPVGGVSVLIVTEYSPRLLAVNVWLTPKPPRGIVPAKVSLAFFDGSVMLLHELTSSAATRTRYRRPKIIARLYTAPRDGGRCLL